MNASILGIPNAQIRERFPDIIDFAELWNFVDMPVKRYSSGMYLRLAFAIAVHCEPDILLMDDTFAVGDIGFQQKCFERLLAFQRRGVTIVLVSHVPDVLRHFCHQVVLLDAGRVVGEGHADAMLEQYGGILARPAGGSAA
jgi:ABC-type polysaccharide/polyol phosphate transport system ATPase subunit